MREVRFWGTWGLALFFCAIASPLYAIDVHVEAASDGFWVVNTPFDGSSSSVNPESQTVILHITGSAEGGALWKIRIRLANASGLENFKLWARRVGGGEGGGTIQGGTSYLLLGNSDMDFFEGTGDRMAIPIQYKITGASVPFPKGIYSAEIVFTVVEL